MTPDAQGVKVAITCQLADGKPRRKKLHATSRAEALQKIERFLREQGLDPMTDMAARFEAKMAE